jgi:hypothetical protein
LAAFDIMIGRLHGAAGGRLRNTRSKHQVIGPALSRASILMMVGIFGRCFWHETPLRLSIVGPNKQGCG